MARKRSVKPTYVRDNKILRLSFGARYLDQNLPCHLDGNGMIEDSMMLIRSSIFPIEDDKKVSASDVTLLVQELLEIGQYVRIDVEGKSWLYRRNFRRDYAPYSDEPKYANVDRALMDSIDSGNTLPPLGGDLPLFSQLSTARPADRNHPPSSTPPSASTSSSPPGFFKSLRAVLAGNESAAGELARELQIPSGVTS